MVQVQGLETAHRRSTVHPSERRSSFDGKGTAGVETQPPKQLPLATAEGTIRQGECCRHCPLSDVKFLLEVTYGSYRMVQKPGCGDLDRERKVRAEAHNLGSRRCVQHSL